jgi:O-antigen ligase
MGRRDDDTGASLVSRAQASPPAAPERTEAAPLRAPPPPEPPREPTGSAHLWWAVAPVAVFAVLLLLATFSRGAFDLRNWAPPTIFALVVLAAFFALGGGRGLPSNPWLRLSLAGIWGLAAWAFLSILWATSAGDAFEGASRVLCYAALVTVPIVMVPSVWGVVIVRWIVVGGLCALAILTLFRIAFDGADVFLAGRLDAPVGYRNATACLFALAFWPLITAAAPREAGRVLRAAALSLAALCLGLAFLTQSRGIVIGLAAGAIVVLCISPDRVRRAWLGLLAVLGVALFSDPLLSAYHAFNGGHGTVTSHDITLVTVGLLGLMAVMFLAGLVIAVFDSGLRGSSPLMGKARLISRIGLGIVALVLVVGALISVGNPVSYAQSKWDEFRSLESSTPTGLRLAYAGGQRYDLWRVALNEFADQPVAGVGIDNYQFGYYQERRTDRNLDNAHSTVFGLLAETGIVGALLMALFLVGIVGTIASRWRVLGRGVRRSVASLASAGAVVIGQSFVDWEWLIPGIMGLGLFCLALAAAQAMAGPRSEAPPERPRRLGIPLRIAAAGALTVAALGLAALFLSDLYVRKARDARATSEMEALEAARTASDFNPLAITPHFIQASALESLGRKQQARAQLEDAADLEPGNLIVYGLLGDFETRRGHPKKAAAFYRQALALDPRDVGLRKLSRRGG